MAYRTAQRYERLLSRGSLRRRRGRGWGRQEGRERCKIHRQIVGQPCWIIRFAPRHFATRRYRAKLRLILVWKFRVADSQFNQFSFSAESKECGLLGFPPKSSRSEISRKVQNHVRNAVNAKRLARGIIGLESLIRQDGRIRNRINKSIAKHRRCLAMRNNRCVRWDRICRQTTTLKILEAVGGLCADGIVMKDRSSFICQCVE